MVLDREIKTKSVRWGNKNLGSVVWRIEYNWKAFQCKKNNKFFESEI